MAAALLATEEVESAPLPHPDRLHLHLPEGSSATVAAAAPGRKHEARALVEEAQAALSRGALDDAARLANEALALDGTLVAPRRIAGLAAFRSGRFAAARVFFTDEKERQTDPADRAVAAFNLAGAELKLGHFLAAELAYRAAADDPVLAPLSLLDAGVAAEEDGRRSDGLKLYRQAEERALAVGAAPIAEKAREHIAAAEEEERSAHREEAWRAARAGTAERKAGHGGEALALLSHAASEADAGSMAPDERADLDYALGHALLDAGRTADALRAFERAVRESPEDAEYHYMLGLALDRVGARERAVAAFTRALAGGLHSDDDARARAYLNAQRPPAPPPRLSVDTQVSAGYDSHYAAGREALFRRASFPAGTSDGAPEILVDIEPRFRLFGSPSQGLLLGDRLNAGLYLASAADLYSVIENSLYLEGSLAPRPWLRLSATVEGYLQTAGIANFALFQTGAQLAFRALFLEGERSATRLRYAVTFMHALDDTPPNDFSYMTGLHHEASATQSFYPGRFRLSLGYACTADQVGTQVQLAADVLGDARDASLRSVFGAGGLYEPVYSIPYSYVGNGVYFDGDGDAAARLHLSFGVRYERRDYLGDVVIAPDPMRGYHKRRSDDRLSFELALRREIWKGVAARASVMMLWSASNIANLKAATPWDYDDKNYLRFVGTLDLLKAF